jgi:hypothetical protein
VGVARCLWQAEAAAATQDELDGCTQIDTMPDGHKYRFHPGPAAEHGTDGFFAI